jgi:hypothetical protein
VNPWWLVVGVIFLIDVIGVPLAFLRGGVLRQRLFNFVRYGHAEDILYAYGWTLYGVLALVALSLVLGTVGAMKRYQRRPLELPAPQVVATWWWWITGFGWIAVFVMFVQAGFTVPWLQVRGANFLDYADSSVMRSYFERRISPVLFNFNLLVFAAGSVILAFFCLRRRTFFHRFAALLLFAASASFSLAKSQLAAALFVILLFVSTTRRLRPTTVLAVGLVLFVCILPFYFLLAYATTVTEAVDQLGARVIYGQWAGLPYYFMLFDQKPQSAVSALPPYVQRIFGVSAESPGRKVMLFQEPQAAMTGVAGNVPTFYVGEAFAIGGVIGALLAPMVVAFEAWLLIACFGRLPKTPFTVLLFSWFMYKLTIGIADGFSAFLLSSFTVGLVLLAMVVVAREGARIPRPA